MEDEDVLFHAWRQGDKRAGEALFRRMVPLLHRYFVNKVDSPVDVEDLIQRTMLGCLEGRERVESELLRPYLFGVARNLLRKHWSQRRNHREEDIDEVPLVELGAGPSTAFARGVEQRLMLEALRKIPLRDQEVLEAHYWEGLTGRELALLFATNENTLRNWIRVAKQRFGKELRRMQNLTRPPLPPTATNLSSWAERIRERRMRRRPPEPEDPTHEAHPSNEENSN